MPTPENISEMEEAQQQPPPGDQPQLGEQEQQEEEVHHVQVHEDPEQQGHSQDQQQQQLQQQLNQQQQTTQYYAQQLQHQQQQSAALQQQIIQLQQQLLQQQSAPQQQQSAPQQQQPAPQQQQPAPQQQQPAQQQQQPVQQQQLQPTQELGVNHVEVQATQSQPVREAPSVSVNPHRPHVTLRHFNGKQSPVTWWAQFIAYITLQRMSNEDAIMTLPFYLYDAAETWWSNLDDHFKATLDTIKAAFLARFRPSSKLNLKLFDVQQKSKETVEDYIHRITTSVADRAVDQDWLIHAITKGLKPAIQRPVVQADPQTLEELRDQANRAEMAEKLAGRASDDEATNTSAFQQLTDQMRDLQTAVNAVMSRPKGAEEPKKPCGNCGRFCESPNCFARNNKCLYCSKLHHFWRVCRKRKIDMQNGLSGDLPVRPSGGSTINPKSTASA